MPHACEADGDASDCDTATGGFFDIPGMIVDAITSFLGTLIEQIMKPVREFLADTLLATPDVTRHADITRLWKVMLGLALGIYVLFITAGGVTVMGYETVQSRYSVQQIAPRLLIGIIAASTSLTVMGKAISLSNALAHAILAIDMADAGQGMVERVLPFALFGGPGLQLYLLIIALVMLCLVIAVLIGFLVRISVMALLAASAPLMLACHAHPLTDPIARLWWRALAGCLVIQVGQSLTFVLALKLFFAPGATTLGIPRSDQLGTMLAGLALFWVLFKIPGWTLQVTLRGTPAAPATRGPAALRLLQNLAMYRLLGSTVPGLGLGLARGGRGSGPRGGPGLGPLRGPSGGWPGPGPGCGPGGGGRRPSPGAGGSPGGSGGRGSGPGRGGPLGWGRRFLSGGRARVNRPASTSPAPPQQGRGLGGSTPTTPGTAARRTASAAAPHAMRHPAQARRRQPLTPPIAVQSRPPQPTRPTRPGLPTTTPRAASAPSRSQASPGRVTARPGEPLPPQAAAPARDRRRTSTGPPPPADRAVPAPSNRPAPRATQLALRIPATRVRVRPPRPMQLRLPLEPPPSRRTLR